MKIVSTTIAGPGSERTIGKALASVAPLVDIVIVIGTCSDHAGNVLIFDAVDAAIAATPDAAGEYYVWPWENDFGAARNAALDFAAKEGADWCLWIDTDEWFEYDAPRASDLRKVLETTDRGALMVYHASRSYCQPRAIRLPTSERWVGKTHECFAAYKVGQGHLDGLTFTESPKTPAELAHKFERDAGILTDEVERDPHNARSWFYLGESLKNLGRFLAAINAYGCCAKLRGWNEESAWACYRAAECYIEIGALPSAIDSCARGLTLHAGVAELAWLAGWCQHKLANHAQAVHWSLMAAAGGEYEGGLRGTPERIGFRYPPALWEAPFNVMRHSYKALGLERAAGVAELKYEAALRMRTQRITHLPRSAVTHSEQAAAAEAVGLPHLADALRQLPERA